MDLNGPNPDPNTYDPKNDPTLRDWLFIILPVGLVQSLIFTAVIYLIIKFL